MKINNFSLRILCVGATLWDSDAKLHIFFELANKPIICLRSTFEMVSAVSCQEEKWHYFSVLALPQITNSDCFCLNLYKDLLIVTKLRKNCNFVPIKCVRAFINFVNGKRDAHTSTKRPKNDSLDCNQQDIKRSLVVCIIGLVPLSIHHLGVFLMF